MLELLLVILFLLFLRLVEIKRLRSLPYREYLRTGHWMRKRVQRKNKAGWKCGNCGSGASRPLEVHHDTYVRLGFELMGDLEVLCNSCHKEEHGL